MRNKNHFNTEWFYKYWLENGGKAITLFDFEQHFFYESVYNTEGKEINRVLKNINALLECMDKKFNLAILMNNKGQFLKVIT